MRSRDEEKSKDTIDRVSNGFHVTIVMTLVHASAKLSISAIEYLLESVQTIFETSSVPTFYFMYGE